MEDFELGNDSLTRATALSSRLMDDVRALAKAKPGSWSRISRETFSADRYSEQAEGVPISDVVANVSRMATEFALAHLWDDKVLCWKLDDGSLAPVSLTQLIGSLFGGTPQWFKYWEEYDPFAVPTYRVLLESLRDHWRDTDDLSLVSTAEAESSVGRNLQSFLSYRFAGFKAWFEWMRENQFLGGSRGPRGGDGGTSPPLTFGPGGGLQVQVSCLAPGLRIHVSPAYFVNWVYFGSPTTPVSSYVPPGRYVFAGDGPMLPIPTMDHAVFSVPPTYHAVLTRF